MSKYKIEYSEDSTKELRKIQKNDVRKIIAKIESLGDDPFPLGNKKIKGKLKLWRIRVGDYRVIYSVEHQKLIIEIIRVRNRKDVYDNF